MSNYAEVIEGKVVQVVVIDDSWSEEEALNFLSGVSPNLWVNTKNSIRYVGINDEYHEKEGVFSSKKPFDSWKLDVKRGIYIPPLPRPIAVPIGYVVKWSEDLKEWVVEKF